MVAGKLPNVAFCGTVYGSPRFGSLGEVDQTSCHPPKLVNLAKAAKPKTAVNRATESDIWHFPSHHQRIRFSLSGNVFTPHHSAHFSPEDFLIFAPRWRPSPTPNLAEDQHSNHHGQTFPTFPRHFPKLGCVCPENHSAPDLGAHFFDEDKLLKPCLNTAKPL